MNLYNKIPSHSPSVVTRKTGHEYILVPVTENIADMNNIFTLNETGAFIWEKIDGRKTVGEIIELVENEFDVDHATAEKDVIEFIEAIKNYLIINME